MYNERKRTSETNLPPSMCLQYDSEECENSYMKLLPFFRPCFLVMDLLAGAFDLNPRLDILLQSTKKTFSNDLNI